jgi:hydroxyacylglutathione hydrolase
MILKRFYDPKLAQASYLIGCGRTGEAVVFDPNRDVGQYLEGARAEGVRVTHVSETHIHADFVSGARELAHQAKARLYLSDEGGLEWKYGYAGEAGATLLKHGDHFQVGQVRVDILHTPGHTPEHLAFLITDTAAATAPIGVITGDFVFVGDVGRPDLLEKAAQVKGTMVRAARELFRGLQAFKKQPEYLQIWPGHGAGSACGKGLSSIPHSTVGYERLFNWAFSVSDEEDFVRQVLEGQPEPPRYFAEMKRINKEGPRILNAWPQPPRLGLSQLRELLEQGAFVIDTRAAAEYAKAFIPGTINIPLNQSFTTWAGWLAPYDRDIYLIVDEHSGRAVTEAIRDLAMIGLDRVAGYFGTSVIPEWAALGSGRLETIRQMPMSDLAGRLADQSVTVIDVRGRSEWEAGHLPGVENIPLGYLAERAGELPKDRLLVLHCQSGGRSAIAASLLRTLGFVDVADLVGGFSGWETGGNKIERETVR